MGVGGGLRERPSLKMGGGGGVQSCPSLKKVGGGGDIGTKNNKETYNFKRVYFGASQVGKVEQMYIFEKGGGLSERSRSKQWSL